MSSEYRNELQGTNIFDAMTFNIGERRPVFDEKYSIPEKLKQTLITAFREHHL